MACGNRAARNGRDGGHQLIRGGEGFWLRPGGGGGVVDRPAGSQTRSRRGVRRQLHGRRRDATPDGTCDSNAGSTVTLHAPGGHRRGQRHAPDSIRFVIPNCNADHEGLYHLPDIAADEHQRDHHHRRLLTAWSRREQLKYQRQTHDRTQRRERRGVRVWPGRRRGQRRGHDDQGTRDQPLRQCRGVRQRRLLVGRSIRRRRGRGYVPLPRPLSCSPLSPS